MSYATTTIAGFLADVPTTKQAGENTVTTLRLATSVRRRDKQGEVAEDTTWWSCKVWGRRGEAAAQHLGKGQPVIVTGTPVLREWQDDEGNKRFSLELRDADWSFTPARKADGAAPAGQQRTVRPAGGTPAASSDEAPF